MDQFVVSARKYRPAVFDSVVGQRHIAETLKNAIRSNHLAQAFLFCGPRGVGKTTSARILAKTINCFNRTENIEACEECDSCKSFNEGHSLNIYELDAASNNSVEDIRGLIEKVRFAPQIGTKKVYIIDEVHMLSTQAFNAFLKTLEEPPSHAIFILATTEKHKVIPTILSRCQVFDFNRIEVEDIARHLEEIAEKEGVKTEHDGLHLIAQKSDGSLRDALSMFDQMVTYSGNEVTYNAVIENLSILSSDYFFNLVNNFVSGEIHASLKLFDEVLKKGFDGHNFLLGLGEHMRNLLVAQDHGTIDLLSVGKQQKEKFREQTLVVSADYLIAGLNLISQADVQYKSSRNQRLLVELMLINLSTLTPGSKNAQLQKKTEALSNTPIAPKAEVKPSPAPVAPTSTPDPEPVVKPAEPIAKQEEHEADLRESAKVVDTPPTKAKDEIAPPKSDVEKLNQEKVKTILGDKDQEVRHAKSPAQASRFEAPLVSESISISDYTAPKKEQLRKKSEEPEVVYSTSEDVTDEKLHKAWGVLVNHYQKENKLSLVATLRKYEPQHAENGVIEFTCDNKAQLQAINAEKTFILGLLRGEMNNGSVQLNTVLSSHENKKAYTPAEKLEKLIAQNPNINLLKEKLDLDLGL